MPSRPSVHDNTLLSYTVEAGERRVILRTAYLDHAPREETTLVFSKVFAYHFEGDTFGTILFDIQEVTAGEIIREFADLFDRMKNYGWPPVSYNSVEELAIAIGGSGVRSFIIHSSCGLDGFVMAESLQYISTKRGEGEERGHADPTPDSR